MARFTSPASAIVFVMPSLFVLQLSIGGEERLDPQPGTQRLFIGHTGAVWTVVFSRDGSRLLTGSGDGRTPSNWLRKDRTIRLWDTATGRETLRIHTGSTVRSVALSHNERYALSGGGDWGASLKLWDVKSGRLRRSFSGHTSVVNAVAFSPDDGTALSASGDCTIRLWDVATGKEKLRISGHEREVVSAVFSPDGLQVLSGSWDKTVRLWNAKTGKEVHCFRGHKSGVYCVAFSPDGKRAASGGGGLETRDYTIRLWDIGSGTEIRQFSGHKTYVFSVAFSPDGRRILSGGGDIDWEFRDGTPIDQSLKFVKPLDCVARLWDVESGKEIQRFIGHELEVKSVAISPDGKQAVTAGFDGTVRMWKMP